jgi:hypothetical protein
LLIDLKTNSFYYENIPPVPELSNSRKFDSAHLKEIRKRLDNAEDSVQEAEIIAFECMDEIAEITSGKGIVKVSHISNVFL